MKLGYSDGRWVLLRKLIARSIPHYFRKLLPPNTTRHLHFRGKFKVRLNGKKLFTMVANSGKYENEIYWYGLEGGLEKRSQVIWAEYCKVFKPQNVLDVGANSGLYSLITSSVSPNSTVSSIEPIPEAIRRMRENMLVNNFPCNIFEGALAEYSGYGDIYLESGTIYASSVTLNTYADLALTGVHDSNKLYKKFSVSVSTLSGLINRGFCNIPNLVKIDVETYELKVLSGFGYDLALTDAYLIEVLNNEIADGLNVFFANKGFFYFNINDRLNSLRRTNHIEKSDFWNYFICKPKVANRLNSLSF